MYPRNAASPERIAIGPVVLIADGTVQTSGVTVRIIPFGGSEADGLGIVAYSTDGVVLYTPTQAETNHTSFVLIAKKSASIPASVTVVTSARSVSGEVQVGGYASGQVPLQPTTAGRTLDVSAGGEAGIDLANIGSPTTTVNLSGVTIKTATDVETDTQDIQSRIPAALVDGRMVANAQVVGDKSGYTATVSDKTGFSLAPTTGLGNQTADITGSLSGSVGSVTGSVGSVTAAVAVSDKTGFKLASDGLALVTSWTVGITGDLTGNVTGSVGSISGVSFPGNFGSLGIDPGGEIQSVLLVDELGEGALTANGAGDAIPVYVWDEAYNTHTTAGTFGKLMDILRKANTLIEGTVTSAVSPTSTAFTSNVNYPTGAFKHAVLLWVTGSLNEQNSPILTYANTNGAITVEEAFTAAPQVGDEFVIIPTTHVHSVAAIAQGVAGTQVMTDLATMIINDGTANARYSVSALQNAPAGEGGGGQTINVYPVSASTPERVAGTTITYYRNEIRSVSVVTDFTLTSLTLSFTIEDSEGTDLLTIADGSISRSDQTFTVSIGTAVTATISNYRWALRDLTGGTNSVIARGVLAVQEAASA